MPTKSFHRSDRVSAQLRRELGTLVHEFVREHNLPSSSVSDVEVTCDLAHAKVCITALMQERSAEAVKGLKALAPQIRFQLGKAMKLRHVPELNKKKKKKKKNGEKIKKMLHDLPQTPVDEEDGAEEK